MTKNLHSVIIAAALAVALPAGAQHPYQDERLPQHERIMDLLSRLTLDEKSDLMQATSFGVPRLGIAKYFHGNEALHGVIRPGRFTVFPHAFRTVRRSRP